MLSIPVPRKDGAYDLFVVMQDENMDRIKAYDPGEVDTLKMGHPWNSMKLRTVVLMYATRQELEQALKCKNGEDVKALLKTLSRGFTYRPDLGDSDGPYQNLHAPKN